MKFEQENDKPDLKDRKKEFSINAIHLFKSMSKDTISQVVGKQLLRSATSVGANTRSAYRGRSSKEFVAKIGIVVEEADESCFWVEIIDEASLSENTMKVKELLKEANELTAIFNSIRGKYK